MSYQNLSNSVIPGANITVLPTPNQTGATIITVASTGGGGQPAEPIVLPTNYINVTATGTYSLSSTITNNVLLVPSAGFTATLNFPTAPVDGQVTNFSVITSALTLIQGSGGPISPLLLPSMTPGLALEYVYRAADLTWYQIGN